MRFAFHSSTPSDALLLAAVCMLILIAKDIQVLAPR
jgi:hypothetical protein